LIGLPPSPGDVEKFLSDKDPVAYEKVVDLLLASPQYGERWVRPWLDLARYADSSGYQRDNLWDIWPYRDWVINALNRDMPFDQFTIEQLAGDLLPDATLEQKIATGFNRCAPINVEAGSDQEESRVNQIFDRVNTVGTVWLGSTIECAQCHNHKYDPFSQKEYYQLFAFFNNTPKESEFANPRTTIALEFAGPYLELPDANIERQRAAFQEKIRDLDQENEVASEKLLAGQTKWELNLAGELGALTQTHLLDPAKFETESGSAHETLEDKSVLLRNDDNDVVPERDTYTVTVHTKLDGITGFKIEALADPSLPGEGPGRGDASRPNFVLTDLRIAVSVPGRSQSQEVELRNPRASFEQKNFAAEKAIDADTKSGWAIGQQFSKDHWAVFETTSPAGSSEGATFVFTLKQNSGASRLIGRLRLSALTGVLRSNDVPADVVSILQTPLAKRSEAGRKRVTAHYLSRQPELEKIKAGRAKLNAELKNLRLPQTLAMQEMDEPRISSTFVRGNFLEKGELVQPDVPSVLPPLTGNSRDRLALARWLVSTNNPLTARVVVNRWWAELFGHGLVTTPEDFGIKGDLPTHPELLDWLACELMEPGRSRGDEALTNKSKIENLKSGLDQSLLTSSPARPWSMKHVHRLIVTSATYRQSSRVSLELLERDDQNKLYARGPRFRMDAEMIRDNALAAAGLLSSKMGGPPVKPVQPPGIWENKVGGVPVTYDVSEGEDRYRRGIYTVWKRTSPYPSFITFDAPTRNACTVKRPRSNTPLQALTLLNDPVYVEAAQALAKRVLTEKPSANVEEKLRYAFALCVGRTPSAREIKILTNLYEEQLQSSRNDVAAAKKLFRDISKPPGVDVSEFAAWYSVATALLNLDETVTKG